MRVVTIADSRFLPYGNSESLSGENAGMAPSWFEWEYTDPQEARFVTDGHIPQARGRGQVAWLCEPFFLHPNNYIEAMKKGFDYVLTHNRYFADHNEGWLWQPHGGSWIALEKWKVHEKTRNVSMILSEKKMLRGHRMRHEVVELCGDFIDDIFGYDHCRVDKMTGLAPYRYSIVIQAEQCETFFSEALVDCFSVGTVPIYWGSSLKGTLFNNEGVIHVRGVKDIEHVLGAIRDGVLKPPAPEIMEENLEASKQYRISEDWIFENYSFLFK